jgi:ABC-type nitrate/sulfonate/bicarbonate transport system ATPase subunit
VSADSERTDAGGPQAAAQDAAAQAGAAPAAVRPPAIEFRHVTKVYGEGTTRQYIAISDVSFTIEDVVDHGEICSFLGPSGCGKSTVLRLVAGLEPQHPPSIGRVTVLGHEVAGPGADRGRVFQDYTSFDNRTVLDNVTFGLECRGMPRRERHALGLEWIAKVGLDPRRDARKYPHELSGGMRQRVAIARTLILRPRIILMDEPFGALDPATRLDMQDLLVKLWRDVEATVLFVTHSVEEAVYLGDRVFVMATTPGRIVGDLRLPPASAPAREIQSQPWFRDNVRSLHEQIERIESDAKRLNGGAT